MAKLTEHKEDGNFLFFTDAVGLRQGKHMCWHRNGKLRSLCYFIDDHIHGEYKYWYENGQLNFHGFYELGRKHGEYKWCRDNGKMTARRLYNMGEDMYIDPSTLTQEDMVVLTLRYGFKWLT